MLCFVFASVESDNSFLQTHDTSCSLQTVTINVLSKYLKFLSPTKELIKYSTASTNMSEGYTQPFNHQINDQVPHPEPGGTLTGTLDQKDTLQSTNASSNQKQKLIKARQSFSLKEKMTYVMAYKRDCILAVEGGVNQSPGSPDGKLKKTKLKAWLSEKNAKDGTNIAYGTMYKWFKRYEKMEPHKGDMNLKKLRARPFAGRSYFYCHITLRLCFVETISLFQLFILFYCRA